ncbi:MAG: potassium channel protein, partial [Microbacteriaceae bacterium]|nr:potassium channel protein [Microbacteriaceae bacterium]
MADKKVPRDTSKDAAAANPETILDTILDVRSAREIRWDNATTWPMIVLSLVFLVAYSVMILDDQPFRGSVDLVILGIITVTYVAFIVDYFVRMHLSEHRIRFVRNNIIDLFSLLIPLLRPLLLLEYLGRIRIFSGASGASLRARITIYAGGSAVLFIYVISLAVFACERHAPGATIVSFGDSLWWAMCTISTVGYGDMVPVTVPGRIFAVMLMLGGVAIVGAATATIVSA